MWENVQHSPKRFHHTGNIGPLRSTFSIQTIFYWLDLSGIKCIKLK